jgi:hypothetical protein
MCDCVFGTILDTGTAFNARINVWCCSFAINDFKDIRGAYVLTDGCSRAFFIVDFEGEIAFFIFIGFNGHVVRTPLLTGGLVFTSFYQFSLKPYPFYLEEVHLAPISL